MELFYELYGNLWTTEDIRPNPHSYKNSVLANLHFQKSASSLQSKNARLLQKCARTFKK